MNQRFPCGQTRREMLWEMGTGFTGLAMTSLLSNDGFFAGKAFGADANQSPNVAGRHFDVKAKSCIFLTMNGAPSQVDTFDFKPELLKHSGKQMPADKKFINSGGRKIGYLTANFRPFRPAPTGFSRHAEPW